MRIAFILPDGGGWFGKRSKGFLADVAHVTTRLCHDLSLITVAGLTDDRFEVVYVDEMTQEVDFHMNVDLVALTAMTHQSERAYQIADAFRARAVPVVMGGVHASVCPEETKAHVDSVVVGEAEIHWPRFLDDFLRGDAKPFYGAGARTLCDLSLAPVPRFDLLDLFVKNAVPIQTTRGCPNDCDFCSAPKIFGSAFRHKTIDQVLKEVERVLELDPAPLIYFCDDNMFANRRFSKELLEALTPYGLKWFTQTDITIGRDEELLKLISRAGCVVAFVGFESVSEESLRIESPWKSRQVDSYPELISRIHDHGILIDGFFVLGMDQDTVDTFQETRDFIWKHKLVGQPSILTPYPGTRTRSRLEREGRLLPKSYSHYNQLELVYRPKAISIEKFEEGYEWLWKEIVDPRLVFRIFKTLRVGLKLGERRELSRMLSRMMLPHREFTKTLKGWNILLSTSTMAEQPKNDAETSDEGRMGVPRTGR